MSDLIGQAKQKKRAAPSKERGPSLRLNATGTD
jgi:hypothetical protein